MEYYSYDYYETGKMYPQETGNFFPQGQPHRPAPPQVAGNYFIQGQHHRPAPTYMTPSTEKDYTTPVTPCRLLSPGSDVNTVTLYQQPDYDNSDPFAAILPSSFPVGTDPKLIESFNRIDKNGDGVIDDRELQSVLSSFSSFDIRTVHLLMYLYTNSNSRMIGPREFVPLYKNLQNWRAIFQRADVDRNGRIDASELRGALGSLGYNVPHTVLNLLISKFDKSKGNYSIGFDNFIEYVTIHFCSTISYLYIHTYIYIYI
ncbi:hypothetical protein Dimus_029727 [Dionaea muscipula]